MGCGGSQSNKLSSSTMIKEQPQKNAPKNSTSQIYSNGRLSPQFSFQIPNSKIDPENIIQYGICANQRVRRSQLSSDAKIVLDQLVSTAYAFQQNTTISLQNVNDLSSILDAFYSDYPEIFWTKIQSTLVVSSGIEIYFSQFDIESAQKRINWVNQAIAYVIDFRCYENAPVLALQRVMNVQPIDSLVEIDSVLIEKQGSQIAILRTFQILLMRLGYQCIIENDTILYKLSSDTQWNAAQPQSGNIKGLYVQNKIQGYDIGNINPVGVFQAQKVAVQIQQSQFMERSAKCTVFVQGYAEDIKLQLPQLQPILTKMGAGFISNVNIIEATTCTASEIYFTISAEVSQLNIEINRI
ncbi:hypothetical protein SS50377_25299 [Spironucleus salmonicida]|uniref:Uncharacterized protein n=1 Tax=Spironucleus salmonicida TaxID=348837 RepID=V6LBI2_9EUKA|nr:hypothetical protein SS50377_25299 [Spironucleus salmonicida]|eukprot:EST41820.1 hypothetical protein SS50377_18654 [Spironucleus salmonicida]